MTRTNEIATTEDYGAVLADFFAGLKTLFAEFATGPKPAGRNTGPPTSAHGTSRGEPSPPVPPVHKGASNRGRASKASAFRNALLRDWSDRMPALAQKSDDAPANTRPNPLAAFLQASLEMRTAGLRSPDAEEIKKRADAVDALRTRVR